MAFDRTSPPSSSNGAPTSESLTPGTNVVTGSFTEDGNSSTFTPNESRFTFSLWVDSGDTYSATITMYRSHDSGITWLPITAAGDTLYEFTSECDEDLSAIVYGDMYRVTCADFASTEIYYRFAQ